MTTIDQTLARVFGYPDFRPGQRPVIEAVVAGRSAAAIFPTGSGKSLCYQLSALHLPNLTLVVSPLLALMQDQLAFLQRHGIAAASLDSSQTKDEARAVMDGVARGEIRILMVSVERLKNERFRAFIRRVPISLLVVDEAHCISEWGHNFRPDYLTLPATRHELGIPQALLLTATATPKVIEDMRRHFAIEAEDVTATGFYRPNLDLQVAPVAADERPRRLVEWLRPRVEGPSAGATVVYVTLQQTAERLAAYLGAAGLPAAAYHAGLDAETRARRQDDFMAGRTPVIVATIAFGMGIDKSDIRAVVHFDLPKSVENYSQEIGRAGRDGAPAECLMLAGRDHLSVLENFTYGDTPERDAIARVTSTLPAAGEDWAFTLNTLSRDSDIRPLPLKTLLVHLELEGVIRPRFSYFAEYRFRLEEPAEALVARFQGERRAFVEAILEASAKARTWYRMDLEALARLGAERGLDTSRQRVITALDYFADKDLITLESKQMTEVFEVRRPVDEALIARLHQAFVDKERAEIERLHAMLALFEGEGCLTRRLADWFGDAAAPERCGHCSGCRGQIASLPSPPPPAPLAAMDAAALTAPLRERLSAAGEGEAATPTLLARFLCGLSSPRLTRHKARQLDGFATLEAYPFGEVRDWLSR
ncbi:MULTISPECIES: RecQ family ATP-dependent DNA helicase [Halomonas]|uniref:ATP-dependent DNA helicase RecQ n=1 Tax=Halomonas halophila TaxID=29573 RepID=A0ABQ0U691_9GAMM|nr:MULTISPECIES: RecQ family ATP-dependent DNA helicase [Halomonas]MDR5888184.1 RecQ family ATP-dependent DNA helicase [Halomonas salina]WJY08703.1 RecQ family ATP-dependent DNA helicase [Halomonas halophila]GEK72529.1 ATP-dependent DNA helicase RecQ [Halomonas halophila]